ncbi:ACT domain-containing protein [Cephalotus follicularis]|uniref:ACT domain-containing protein ACR n=1 Tax=Cephalotus follicularis TaxID=3775 RepID=A0A1Q3C727_CEPFO|nr:ACT domain-containing protein [Cephalotus follicularis]
MSLTVVTEQNTPLPATPFLQHPRLNVTDFAILLRQFRHFNMGIPFDDVVLIQPGRTPDDPCVVTVNCPDKPGLGCDLSRIILEFGLCVTRGDFTTDGRWCYVVLWVVPNPSSHTVDWESLKNRLFSVCPSCLVSFYFNQQSNNSSSASTLYLLKFCCLDRKGLLHDVTKVLTELEFMIQRVKVMTTPDDRVVDLFFITDGLDLLHTKKRRDDTCQHLISVFGVHCIGCELQLASPQYFDTQGFSSLPPAVAEELFSTELLDKEASSQAAFLDKETLKKATITVDNVLSPAHTLLQIQCVDQKGLLYDILRTSKDCNIQIAYGRFSSSVEGNRSLDLFVQQTDGKKIVDPEHQLELCSRLREEMLYPFRVTITNRGPDTELLVANPVELSGIGRPRVFYDITLALKMLGICIFSAEVGRHSTSDRQWEVYRFLLDDSLEFPLASKLARSQIVERVRRTLMGW